MIKIKNYENQKFIWNKNFGFLQKCQSIWLEMMMQLLQLDLQLELEVDYLH
jgi:hypothetical protein